jgi:hypothetical protein
MPFAQSWHCAPGIGLILEVDLETGDRVELIGMMNGSLGRAAAWRLTSDPFGRLVTSLRKTRSVPGDPCALKALAESFHFLDGEMVCDHVKYNSWDPPVSAG